MVAMGVVVAAAGCGDTEQRNAYVDAVNKAQARFVTTFQDLRDQITATSTPEQDRATLTRFRKAVDAAVAELQAIDPPAQVADLHGRLVGDIGRYGEEIDAARESFGSPDPQRVVAAQTRLVNAVSAVGGRINATIDAINRSLRG